MPFLAFFLAVIEAKEACTWLRAAGFPQYAQLYEGEETTAPILAHLSILNWMGFFLVFLIIKGLLIDQHSLFTMKSVKGSCTRQNKAFWATRTIIPRQAH